MSDQPDREEMARSQVDIHQASTRSTIDVALAVVFVVLHSLKIALFCQYVSGLHFSYYALTLNLSLTLAMLTILVWMIGCSRILLLSYGILHYVLFCGLVTYREYAGTFLTLDAITSTWREALMLTPGESFPIPGVAFLVFIDLPLWAVISWRRIRLCHGRPTWLVLGAAVGLAVASHGFFQFYVAKGLKRDSGTVVRLQGVLPAYVLELGMGSPSKLGIPPEVRFARRADPAIKRIIVVQVESLDGHVIRTVHDDQPVMPFLHQLRRTGLYVPWCLSYHYIGGSSDCDFSILTGLEPSSAGISMKMITEEVAGNSVPRRLGAMGYDYAIFNAYGGGLFGRGSGYAKVGAYFYGSDSMGLPTIVGNPDSRIFEKYLEESLRYRSDRTVSHLITVTSHTPFDFVYTLDGRSREWFSDVSDARVRNYFASMRYVDDCLRSLFARLDLMTTAVLIVGDHSPAVPFTRRRHDSPRDRPWYDSSFIDSEGRLLEFTSVLLVGPGVTPLTCKEVATFPDISATILALAGYDGVFKSRGIPLPELAKADDATSGRKVAFKGGSLDSRGLLLSLSAYGSHAEEKVEGISIAPP
jgi:hypothetical protein